MVPPFIFPKEARDLHSSMILTPMFIIPSFYIFNVVLLNPPKFLKIHILVMSILWISYAVCNVIYFTFNPSQLYLFTLPLMHAYFVDCQCCAQSFCQYFCISLDVYNINYSFLFNNSTHLNHVPPCVTYICLQCYLF